MGCLKSKLERRMTMAMYKVKVTGTMKVEIDATTEEDAISQVHKNYDLGKELVDNVSISVKRS